VGQGTYTTSDHRSARRRHAGKGKGAVPFARPCGAGWRWGGSQLLLASEGESKSLGSVVSGLAVRIVSSPFLNDVAATAVMTGVELADRLGSGALDGLVRWLADE
jgi:hypothetical protein